MLTTAEIAPSLRPGMHAATFGGNPIAARAGIAAIEMIENENLLENAARIGDYCHSKFEAFCSKYSFIDSPRGIGLMQAVNVKHHLAPVIVQQALEHGLLMNALGTSTLRIVPPLNMTKADVDEAADLLRTTRKAIYAMVERRLLPGVTRVGRRVLIRRDDLLDWLRHKSAPSPKE